MLSIYKPGQGYWTRTLSAAGAAILVVAGAAWLSGEIGAAIAADYRIVVQASAAVAVILAFAVLVFWLLGLNKKSVEFLIATEAEMRKVAWPTRRELMIFTWVVICGTLMLAGGLFVVDVVLFQFFKLIGVLQV